MSKSKSENKKLTSAQGTKTQHHQAHPNAGKTFSPRGLFRGLTVPYSNKPGQKYLYPNLRDKDGRQLMTPQEYRNHMRPVRVKNEQG